jgi:hypothetical protein
MSRNVENRRCTELIRLLAGLRDLQQRLAATVEAKLAAMKCADLAKMSELSVQEQNLVRQIQEREGLRRQLLDAIGEQWGLPPRSARVMTVSQLAQRLDHPVRFELMAEAEALRSAVLRVARLNRIVGVASREVLDHMNWILSAVRPVLDGRFAYGRGGVPVAPADSGILEVVG